MTNNKAYRLTQIASSIAISASALLILPVQAAIMEIPYNSIVGKSGANLIDFADFNLAVGFHPETIMLTGSAGDVATFGQNFAGQDVTTEINGFGAFDTIPPTPTPSNPLTVEAGEAVDGLIRNLYVDLDLGPGGMGGTGFTVLAGVGPGIRSEGDGSILGEGAVSVQFEQKQSEFGFFLVSPDGIPELDETPNLYVSFFREDGSEIGRFETLAPYSEFGYIPYGFQVEGGEAIIAGVSIYNLDFEGVSFANFVSYRESEQQTIPEPSSWLGLLAVGLVGVASTIFKIRVK